MEHNHQNHTHSDKSIKNIKSAFILNFTFTIIEVIGGLLTNSMAILADALHDLGDSISLLTSYFLQKYSKKSSDKNFTFGYARFSLLAALINSVILVIGSLFIFFKAIPRLINPEPVNPKGMLILAVIGIVVNSIAAYRLNKGTSLNEKVVSWHMIEDLLGWISVLVVSIILIYKKIYILDALLSIGLNIFILYNILKKLKKVLKLFLQGVPDDISIENIEKTIKDNNLVLDVHHIHIWSMEGEKNLLTAHVVVKDSISKNAIIELKENLKNKLLKNKIHHTTIEIDFESEDCKDLKH
ncbi:MAG: cation diffusion facilitator family transporter [Bacillota bacterium]